MSSRPKVPKYARNKNILVFGGSGSGYTLWGASGLADMGEASGDVALTLAPGDGVFLRLEAPAN